METLSSGRYLKEGFWLKVLSGHVSDIKCVSLATRATIRMFFRFKVYVHVKVGGCV